MNGGLVRRSPNCYLCKSVAAIEDVTVRLFAEGGARLPAKEAFNYLRGLGMAGSDTTIYHRIAQHAKHVARDLERLPAVIDPQTVVVAAPVGGPPGWIGGSKLAVSLVPDLLRELAERAPDMSDRDLIAATRTLLSQVTQQGNWARQGRELDQRDALIDLLSGFDGPT